MLLSELLAPDRIALVRQPTAKPEALSTLARLLSTGCATPADDLHRVLVDREELQSTGIGEGVAIPHGALTTLDRQIAALLIVPAGLEFGAIDGNAVYHLFAVVGPKRDVAEHLRTLARISKLLRSTDLRARLLAAVDSADAYRLIESEERARA